MKDAFGGAFMLRIMIVFFVIFVIFISVAIQYTRAFNAKDVAISIFEHTDQEIWEDQFKELIGNSTYKFSGTQYESIKDKCDDLVESNSSKASGLNVKNFDYTKYGICVVPVGNEESYYFRVYSFVYINTPLFDIKAIYPISGETKLLND